MRLNHFPHPGGVTLGDADAVDVGAGVAGSGGEGITVDVVDLSGPGGSVDVDEFAAHRDDRQPRPRMHHHPRLSDRGKQSHLRGPDDRTRADCHVTGLHVVADASDVVAAVHAVTDLDLLIAAVGPPQRHHRVGESGHGSTGFDTDGLPRLQPGGSAGTRAHLPDHRQRHDHRLVGFEIDEFGSAGVEVLDVLGRDGAGKGHVDGPHRIAVDGGLIEAGHREFGDHLFGAHQSLGLRDRHAHRARGDGRGGHQRQMILDRPHLTALQTSPDTPRQTP